MWREALRLPAVDLDCSVPVLLVKIGRYPLDHGGLGAVRSLGRVGVPVFAVTEDALTPIALSRYASGIFVWPTVGRESQESLVEGLASIGRRLDERAVVLCTDDEASVLLAEHAEELSEWFVLPPVPPGLPRLLTSKDDLSRICAAARIPAPSVAAPRTRDELEAFIDAAVYPLIAKNDSAWTRLSAPAVRSTTVVRSKEHLRELAALWVPPFGVVLQEYIPADVAEDWMCQAWVGADAASTTLLTGIKLRTWPPEAGVASQALAADNAAVVALSGALFTALGYRGVADLDWRYDRRDGRYKLLDFNPRVGAQFRLFETTEGIDVVRAAHLDLSGRRIPPGRQIVRRSLTIEHLDAISRLSRRHNAMTPPSVTAVPPASRTRAWFAADDPLPFAAMAVRAAGLLGDRRRRGGSAPSGPTGTTPAPVPPLVRERRRRPAGRTSLRDDLGTPLFRNGHALVLSSAMTAVIGVAFWVLAAHVASPAVVGRNSVAINVLTFLGGVAQLNLQSALLRFVQPAGRRTGRLVVGVYVVSAGLALAMAGLFLLLIPEVAPKLAFVRSSAGMALWFAVSAGLWSIMILEDGVLTGLRKTHWVPVENAGFSMLKAGMVVPFVALLPAAGIFVSWTVATLITVIPTNLYLFARAIPRHHARADGSGDVTLRQLGEYVPFDFLGNLFWLAVPLVLPLCVLGVSGAAPSAYFSLAWMFASILYVVSLSIGDSLVVELSIDATELRDRCRRVMTHLLKILTPVVALLVLLAPEVLRLFGRSYAAGGTGALRLLGMSGLPFIVTGTAVSAARGQRRTGLVVAMFAGLFVLVVPLGLALLSVAGITGLALAVLVGHTALAAVLLANRSVWMRGVVRAAEPAPWL